jgi:hypothetical protein
MSLIGKTAVFSLSELSMGRNGLESKTINITGVIIDKISIPTEVENQLIRPNGAIESVRQYISSDYYLIEVTQGDKKFLKSFRCDKIKELL